MFCNFVCSIIHLLTTIPELSIIILHVLTFKWSSQNYLLHNVNMHRTPLMLACTKDSKEMVETLVEYGASLRLRNKDGWTAFHITCREGHPDIVHFLLDTDGSCWETVSKNGRTPLHSAGVYVCERESSVPTILNTQHVFHRVDTYVLLVNRVYYILEEFAIPLL